LEYVTITHPHHPLYGQRCEVVRLRRGVDPDLVLRLADGTHAAIAMSWTDAGEGQGLPAAQRRLTLPLLDLQGLRQIVPMHIKLSAPRKLLWHYRVAISTIMPTNKELPYDDNTTGGLYPA
jgi:Family of unknown function (DUF5372)